MVRCDPGLLSHHEENLDCSGLHVDYFWSESRKWSSKLSHAPLLGVLFDRRLGCRVDWRVSELIFSNKQRWFLWNVCDKAIWRELRVWLGEGNYVPKRLENRLDAEYILYIGFSVWLTGFGCFPVSMTSADVGTKPPWTYNGIPQGVPLPGHIDDQKPVAGGAPCVFSWKQMLCTQASDPWHLYVTPTHVYWIRAGARRNTCKTNGGENTGQVQQRLLSTLILTLLALFQVYKRVGLDLKARFCGNNHVLHRTTLIWRE